MEIWKTIEGFERYEVSNLGNVRSKDMIRINKRFQHGKHQEFKCFYPGKTLKPDISDMGNSCYKRVTLSKDNKLFRTLVHQLVAKAFIPNPEGKPYVNHKDNNGMNNTVSNLEWVTHSENMLWAQKQNRLFAAQSKAGSIGGSKQHNSMIKGIRAKAGTKVGKWTRSDKFEYINGHWKVLCTCECGFQKWLHLYRLNPANKNCATMCTECYHKSRSNKDKDIV